MDIIYRSPQGNSIVFLACVSDHWRATRRGPGSAGARTRGTARFLGATTVAAMLPEAEGGRKDELVDDMSAKKD